MSFFDSTPTGRILNRFSKDQDQVRYHSKLPNTDNALILAFNQIDDLLPDSLLQALQYLLIVISSLVLVSVLLPWFTLVLLPFFVLFWFFGVSPRSISQIIINRPSNALLLDVLPTKCAWAEENGRYYAVTNRGTFVCYFARTVDYQSV